MEEKIKKNKEDMEVDFISLSEAAKKTGYTPEYLNLLSRKGSLRAKKIGRNWYTKESWVESFLSKSKGLSDGGKEEKILNAEFSTEKKVSSENTDIPERYLSLGQGEKKTKIGNNLSFILPAVLIIALPLIFLSFNFRKISHKNDFFSLLDGKYDFQIINENSQLGEVAGEEIENKKENGIVLASENYRIGDMNLGGDILIVANSENLDLEINNIKSETFIDNKKNESKLIVSWQTNKAAVSEIEVARNNGQENKKIQESSFGFSHSAIVPGLTQGTSYVYQIKCKDRWANEKKSDFFGIYTPAKPISVFDLIVNAIGEVFGWAVKK